MTNTYRATSDYGKAIYGEAPFEGDFTRTEEADHINGRHLELVPRKYKVLSDNFAAGEQGSEITATYLLENEQALIQGGHIERVAAKGGPTKKTATAAGDDKKED